VHDRCPGGRAGGVCQYVQRFRGGSEFIVEPGALVRENQVLLRLPDPSKMQVKANINESRISMVRSGMSVSIEFDAIRGKKFRGRVTRVNQYAEPTSWRTGNIREYAAFIEIFDPPAEVRSGMSAEVRILAEQKSEALQVPVQALYETRGRFFCLLKEGDRWETREIQVGSSNDSYMTIQSGLDEGQRVVLNPRAYADRLELPDMPDPPPGESPAELAGAPAGDRAGPGASGPGLAVRDQPVRAGRDEAEKDRWTRADRRWRFGCGRSGRRFRPGAHFFDGRYRRRRRDLGGRIGQGLPEEQRARLEAADAGWGRQSDSRGIHESHGGTGLARRRLSPAKGVVHEDQHLRPTVPAWPAAWWT
jgi:hypothetical protein